MGRLELSEFATVTALIVVSLSVGYFAGTHYSQRGDKIGDNDTLAADEYKLVRL